jgi:hypothetical protein
MNKQKRNIEKETRPAKAAAEIAEAGIRASGPIFESYGHMIALARERSNNHDHWIEHVSVKDELSLRAQLRVDHKQLEQPKSDTKPE